MTDVTVELSFHRTLITVRRLTRFAWNTRRVLLGLNSFLTRSLRSSVATDNGLLFLRILMRNLSGKRETSIKSPMPFMVGVHFRKARGGQSVRCKFADETTEDPSGLSVESSPKPRCLITEIPLSLDGLLGFYLVLWSPTFRETSRGSSASSLTNATTV